MGESAVVVSGQAQRAGALPSAQRDLAFTNAGRPWVVTAYSLASGGLLLLGGRLSDLVGRRRMLRDQEELNARDI